MDLYAFAVGRDEAVSKYLSDNYGEIPRFRGVRFMKLESKIDDDDSEESEMFNEYVGEDVIYIHTRCGNCGSSYDDPDTNYIYCGGKEWEDAHKDLFLDHISEAFDPTYCTHYFKAVTGEEYEKILEIMQL